MTQYTDRFSIPYPGEREPWYDTFEQGIQRADAVLFALYEHANTLVWGGGDVTWSGGTLTWTEDIEFMSSRLARRMIIPAGSLAIADAKFAVVELVAAPSDNVSTELTLVDGLTTTEEMWAFAHRRGDVLYLSGGVYLNDEDRVTGITAYQPGAGNVRLVTGTTGITTGMLLSIDANGKLSIADKTVNDAVVAVALEDGGAITRVQCRVVCGPVPIQLDTVEGAGSNGVPVYLGTMGQATVTPPVSPDAYWRIGTLQGANGETAIPSVDFRPTPLTYPVGTVAAADVTYNNGTSGLVATDAQAALDEIEGRLEYVEPSLAEVNTSGGPVTVNLPTLLTRRGPYIVVDASNNASVGNITVTPDGSDMINNVPGSVIIASDGGSITLYPAGATWYVVAMVA